MTDWALSTNLYTWAQVHQGFFGWPARQAEADRIRTMKVGDRIVPKYAQSASWNPATDAEIQQGYLTAIEADPGSVLASYEKIVAAGTGAVPHVLQVIGTMDDDERPGSPWARVAVNVEPLVYPLSTKEFLRLRTIPPTISAQFKGAVGPGRHVQVLPGGAAQVVLQSGASSDRGDFLRRYSLVRASSSGQAIERLTAEGRPPLSGDRAYLVTSGGLLGVFDCVLDGSLKAISEPIPTPTRELISLIEEAKQKATRSDYFGPSNANAALAELQNLLNGAPHVIPIDDFGRWHDRYELLFRNITLAYEIAQRPVLANMAKGTTGFDAALSEAEEPSEAEAEEAAALAGLSIDDVRAELPDHITLPDEVLREVVTALRSGKHLLLGGPPGTGKSTLAEAVARAVVGTSYEVTTATADWTTFDTIGGYLPDARAGIAFYPGVVLRGLRSGSWLVIDELNRADIDKAFGVLFTLLNGDGGTSSRRAVLPYHDSSGVPITISWAEQRLNDTFTITPHWRLIGTLNLADKASLFQLSFAFLRRFAVVDIPLPAEAAYSDLLGNLFADVEPEMRDKVCAAALEVAFGPRQVGPAILSDVAKFVAKAVAPVASGAPTYADPVEAFLVGVKLMVVSQYEGAEPGDGRKLIAALKAVWPERPEASWAALSNALESVCLK